MAAKGVRAWSAALCGLLLLTAGSAPARPAAAPLEPGLSALDLAPHTRYLRDPDATATPAQMFARADAGGFAPLPPSGAAFGFQDGAYWFHLALRNLHPDEPRWLLLQEYPLSDRIDVYARYPDGRVVHQAGGDHLPFDARSIRYRHPNFLLDLPVGARVDVLVRVRSQSSMQVPLKLYTPTAFAELSRDAQLAIGIYYGILLALFFYNLVLWVSLRDASYFWYLFHITAFGLVLFTLNGLGFEYLWPDWPWLADKAVPLSICLALIGMQQFARTFLELPRRWPLGNKVTLAIIAFFVLLGFASLQLPYDVSTPIATRAVLAGVAWIVVATIVVLRRGYAPAWLFLLAWAMFLMGTFVFSLLAFGLLPKNLFTEYGVQIGSALEMLLLSVALGYRYASLRNENERIVRNANELLERNVELRTAELKQALAQLGEANTQLREYSRRDPLTGVYNRRHFHEAFERHLGEALAQGRPLALLIADLDNFKHINDSHGHLAGDECLRWVAHCFEETLAPRGGLVARFGGEEFVALLPGMDAQAALQAAEAVRRRILEESVRSAKARIRLSVSVGVHSLVPERPLTPEEVIAIADEALYRAKRDGRNCVRHSMSAA
jgi:two-component system, sensor histidine kinase LadS